MHTYAAIGKGLSDDASTWVFRASRRRANRRLQALSINRRTANAIPESKSKGRKGSKLKPFSMCFLPFPRTDQPNLEPQTFLSVLERGLGREKSTRDQSGTKAREGAQCGGFQMQY
jgi:hypothetical protein